MRNYQTQNLADCKEKQKEKITKKKPAFITSHYQQ